MIKLFILNLSLCQLPDFLMTSLLTDFLFFDVSLISSVFFLFNFTLSAHTDCLYCFVKELHVFAVTTGAYITNFFFLCNTFLIFFLLFLIFCIDFELNFVIYFKFV